MPPALVLGGASCVWDDVATWERTYGDWDGLVIAVNDVALHWRGKLHHWVTVHPEKLRGWMRSLHATSYETWSCRPRWAEDVPLVDNVLPPWHGADSGLYAVQVAQYLGCQHVILCGIPMTATAHFAESAESFPATWGSAERHWLVWRRRYLSLQHVVRSMSGRTRELFGAPSTDWLRA